MKRLNRGGMMMKLLLFFGIIVLAIGLSVFASFYLYKKTNKLLTSWLGAVITSIIILFLGSVWWFLTETDGISQGLGILYYSIAAGILAVVNLLVITIIKHRRLAE